jgi:hypothetical protein
MCTSLLPNRLGPLMLGKGTVMQTGRVHELWLNTEPSTGVLGTRAVAIIVAVGLLAGVTWCRDHAAAAAFCPSAAIRNYGPPLEEMRPVAHPPANGALPSGPKTVRLAIRGGSTTHLGGGRIGFLLQNRSGRVVKPRVLIESSIVAVNQRGQNEGSERKVNRRVRNMRSRSTVDLGFVVESAPRMYRVDAQAWDLRGKRLWSYSEYFRIVRRTVEVQLGVSAGSYQAGKVVLFRLENVGSAQIFFGYEFALEMWDGRAWSFSPATPDGFEQVGLGIGGGHSERCQKFQLPADLAPGRYRISKHFSAGLRASSREVRAMFNVV